MKIKLSKSQWEFIGKKTGWMKKANVSIFDLVKDWEREGYGIALIDSSTDKVIQPYIDPSDFPDLIFDKSKDGAKSIDGKYYIKFHSGILEQDPDYLIKKRDKMKIKLSKSQWNKLNKKASVPLTDEQRQQMAKEGIYVLLNHNNALPNLSKTQVDAIVEELKNSGATDFFKQLDVKNVLQIPYIYKLDNNSIIEIDGQQYLVLDVDEGRDVKKKSIINGVTYEKGQRYPGKVICANLDNGNIDIFPLDDVITHIKRPSFINEETLKDANEAISKHNKRIEAIEKAAGATKLVLQIESVKIAIQDRLGIIDKQISYFSKLKENPMNVSPAYTSWIEYLRNGIKTGLFSLKDTFDTILFLYQSTPEEIIQNINTLNIPEEIKPGIINIANGEIEKRQANEFKEQSKQDIIEEQLEHGVSEEKDIQEQTLSPLALEDIPEKPYKKSVKYKTLYHWISSLNRIMVGLSKDKEELQAILNSLNGMEKFLADMEKGTRTVKYLSSPEGKPALDEITNFLNKAKLFINRYIINIVEDGKINSKLLGRGGQPGNAVLAIDLHKLYNVIQRTLSDAISYVPQTTEQIKSPKLPETVASKGDKMKIKLSKSQWEFIGKKTGWMKEAKKKKKWNPNPWAVCHTTVDKDKNPEKFERCVKEVKEKQK